MALQGGSVTLPTAVLEQEKEAQELFEKMYGKEGEGKTEVDTGAPTEVSTTDGESAEKVEEKPVEDGEAAQPAADDKASTLQAEYDALKVEHEKLQHSHSVLQGKYNAEVPRGAERIRELEAKAAALEVRATDPKPKVEAAAEDTDKLYASIENDFGKDTAKTFKQAVQTEARKIAEEAIKSIRGEVEGIGKVVAKTREERFLSDLTAMNKSWRETFASDSFKAMLGEIEPFTGKSFGDLAQEANDAMDAMRLAKIYNLFDSRQTAPTAKVVAPAVKEEVKSKESLIVPDGSSKAKVSGGDKPDYIKAEDIERYYQDMALGRYADRPKEATEMEGRINRAIANRWVIGG